MTDSQRIIEIKKYMDLSHAPSPWFWQWQDLITDYRARKERGESRSTIVNAWKAQGHHPTMVAAFVNASERIDAGVPIQDPGESPTWSEVYDVGLGRVDDYIPWKSIITLGLAYAFVTQGLPRMLDKR